MSSMEMFEYLKIPIRDIRLATNNFGDDKYISKGGFGKVYKGELFYSGRQVMVAVKRFDQRCSGQGSPEFWNEIHILSHYKHENIVHLLGFSVEDDEKILVYKYLPNTSLNMHISSPSLSWVDRLNICIGVARGLKYLHNSRKTKQSLFHCDLKSANVLLDAEWNAKISDFGLSKFGPANEEFSSIFCDVGGTFGYLDPLYMETGLLEKESDIYSFGVVLLEVLCGRLVFGKYVDGRQPLLSELAQNCYEEKKMDTIVLKCLQEQISPCCLDKFSTIAYRCLQQDHNERPQIAEIKKQLKVVLRCQVACDIWKEKKLKSHALFHLIEHQQTRKFMEERWSDLKELKGLIYIYNKGETKVDDLASTKS